MFKVALYISTLRGVMVIHPVENETDLHQASDTWCGYKGWSMEIWVRFLQLCFKPVPKCCSLKVCVWVGKLWGKSLKFPFRVSFGQVVDLHVNALQPWRPVVELYWISLPRKEIVTKHQRMWVRVQHQRSDHRIPLLFLLLKNKSCKSWLFFLILFFRDVFFGDPWKSAVGD